MAEGEGKEVESKAYCKRHYSLPVSYAHTTVLDFSSLDESCGIKAKMVAHIV